MEFSNAVSFCTKHQEVAFVAGDFQLFNCCGIGSDSTPQLYEYRL